MKFVSSLFINIMAFLFIILNNSYLLIKWNLTSLLKAIYTYLLTFIVNVLPIPETFSYMTRNQMVFRDKRKKSPSTHWIPGVASFHLNGFHTFPHFYIFGTRITLRTPRRIRQTNLIKTFYYRFIYFSDTNNLPLRIFLKLLYLGHSRPHHSYTPVSRKA